MQEWDYIDEFHDGVAEVRLGALWGLIDRYGNCIAEPRFDYVGNFSEGLALVRLPGDREPHRYIDKSGTIVLNLLETARVFESFDFHEDVTRAYDFRNMMGFVDRKGQWVIPPRRWTCLDFSDGRAIVIKDGKYGFIDHKGKIVIPLQFDYADSFVNGVARVRTGDRIRYIDPSGRYVKKPGKKDWQHTCMAT